MIAIGDAIGRCLSFIGVTKQRVAILTRREDCGCENRQALLNEWGYSWQRRLARPLHRVYFRWLMVRQGPLAVRLWIAKRHFSKGLQVLLYGR
jgi:hypothetical protein